MIDAVDLFCGAGGLTAGMRNTGITVHAGYDIEGQCAYAYQENNQAAFVKKDVQKVTAEELLAWYRPDRYRLLAGCAPCQPFSTYNQGKDTRDSDVRANSFSSRRAACLIPTWHWLPIPGYLIRRDSTGDWTAPEAMAVAVFRRRRQGASGRWYCVRVGCR